MARKILKLVRLCSLSASLTCPEHIMHDFTLVSVSTELRYSLKYHAPDIFRAADGFHSSEFSTASPSVATCQQNYALFGVFLSAGPNKRLMRYLFPNR
jgi:hypothetical protein